MEEQCTSVNDTRTRDYTYDDAWIISTLGLLSEAFLPPFMAAFFFVVASHTSLSIFINSQQDASFDRSWRRSVIGLTYLFFFVWIRFGKLEDSDHTHSRASLRTIVPFFAILFHTHVIFFTHMYRHSFSNLLPSSPSHHRPPGKNRFL